MLTKEYFKESYKKMLKLNKALIIGYILIIATCVILVIKSNSLVDGIIFAVIMVVSIVAFSRVLEHRKKLKKTLAKYQT
jgi:membrane protein implicated in regulation of membrane protease activity